MCAHDMSREDTGTIVVSADPHAEAASAVTEEQKAILQTVLDQLGLSVTAEAGYKKITRSGWLAHELDYHAGLLLNSSSYC